jgi:hypothetical protein
MMDLVTDRDRLVAALRQRGIDWLAPSDACGAPVPDILLIASLATHHDPRLRQALIGLFLLRPDLAIVVPCAMGTLDTQATYELQASYTAAVYLQTMWRIRLGHYLPVVRILPDHYSQALHLPPREDEWGKAGLYALAAWHAHHTPFRSNYVSVYMGVAELLFASLKLKRDCRESPTTR